MAKQEVEVTIEEDGTVEFKAHGFKGKGCLKALEELQKALGAARGAPKPTPEMYEGLCPTNRPARR